MSKETKMKNSKEGIQLVYVRFAGMWLVFANENVNQYKAGIQSRYNFSTSKFTVNTALSKNFGI